MEGFDERRAKKLLNLPKKSSVVMFLGVGKRADNGIYNTRYRFNREKFVHTL